MAIERVNTGAPDMMLMIGCYKRFKVDEHICGATFYMLHFRPITVSNRLTLMYQFLHWSMLRITTTKWVS